MIISDSRIIFNRRTMNYAYTKKLNMSFAEALDEVRLSFADVWFWVVANIDVAEKIRKKAQSDYGEYVIFGMCAPDIAYKFLNYNMDLWVFMPCSVAVYEKDGDVYVSAGLPQHMLPEDITDKDIVQLTLKVTKSIQKAVDNI